jgi:hypothetical protein
VDSGPPEASGARAYAITDRAGHRSVSGGRCIKSGRGVGRTPSRRCDFKAKARGAQKDEPLRWSFGLCKWAPARYFNDPQPRGLQPGGRSLRLPAREVERSDAREKSECGSAAVPTCYSRVECTSARTCTFGRVTRYCRKPRSARSTKDLADKCGVRAGPVQGVLAGLITGSRRSINIEVGMTRTMDAPL